MEIDDDATQHPKDSRIWLGMGVAPRNGDAFSRYTRTIELNCRTTKDSRVNDTKTEALAERRRSDSGGWVFLQAR